MDHSLFNHINTFVFDVDGVLTDSTVLVTESGDLLRKMNVRDGQAIKYALDAGYTIAIITKGRSIGVKDRLKGLGIQHIYDALIHKREAFSDLRDKLKLRKEEMLYMGDDIPDLDLRDEVGVFTCPNDACPEVLSSAQYISPNNGGHACVREIIQRVLKIQGKWIS